MDISREPPARTAYLEQRDDRRSRGSKAIHGCSPSTESPHSSGARSRISSVVMAQGATSSARAESDRYNRVRAPPARRSCSPRRAAASLRKLNQQARAAESFSLARRPRRSFCLQAEPRVGRAPPVCMREAAAGGKGSRAADARAFGESFFGRGPPARGHATESRVLRAGFFCSPRASANQAYARCRVLTKMIGRRHFRIMWMSE